MQIGCTTLHYFCTVKQKYNTKRKEKTMWIDDDGFYHDDYEGTYAHDVAGFDEETIYDAFEANSVELVP